MSKTNPTSAELEALVEQLDVERQALELEREQFQKFMKPAMHAFGKMLPQLPLYLQQDFRTQRAAELAHLARAMRDLSQVVTYASWPELRDKLSARVETLIAQCAQP